MQILLSNSQAGPGSTVKQEQEEILRNHVQTFICLSVNDQRRRDSLKAGLLVESGSWNIPSLPVALLCFNVPDADESIAPPPQAKRGTQRERGWTFKVQEFIHCR